MLQNSTRFFNTVVAKINERKISTSFALRNTLRESKEKTMFLSTITVNEVESAIKEPQDKKATVPNSIPSKIPENNRDVLSKLLCDLINLIFVSGTFPQELKTAKIIPVYKKGDPLDWTNYCPISLLSNVGNLIENLINSRMNTWIYRFQKSVWIQKKTLDRSCLDNYYRKDPECAWQQSI